MREVIKFLKDLSKNNNKAWFDENKLRYHAVKEKIDLLTQLLIAAVAELDSDASRLSVKDCTYRIYRDLRFSQDKTPYKTHIGIFVNPPFGKKGLTGGYYLHIEPGNCMFAAGNICHPAPLLKAIRQSILDNMDEYQEIVESNEFKKFFFKVGDNLLKTVPKGFPKDIENIRYILPRDFVAYSDVPIEKMKLPEIIPALRPMILQAKRFNDFLNFTCTDMSANLLPHP